MRSTWVTKRGWCLGLMLLAGCWTTDWTTRKDQRPPKQPEEFVLPPDSSARFSSPPDFPQEAHKDRLAKMKQAESQAPGVGPGSSRFSPTGGMR